MDDLRWLDGGQELHLDQRAGRLAAPVRRVARREAAAAATPGAFDLHNPPARSASGSWRAWTRRRLDLLHARRRRTRPSSTSTAAGSTARASPSGSRRRISRGTTCIRSRPTAAGRSTATPRSARRPWSSWSACPITGCVRTLVENREAQGRRGAAARGAGGVREGGRRQRPPARRLDHQAARLRLDQAVPALLQVYGEPAAQTVLDQWAGDYLWHLMLAQQGYVVASRGQPRHARAARPGLAEGDLPEDRRSSTPRDQAAAARDHARAGRGWIPAGSACGAGAAAAR